MKPTYEELEKQVQALKAELNTCMHAEEELRRSRYYLDRITKGMYESLVVVDRNYIIQDANDCFLREYGTTREEVLGKTCHAITHGLSTRCSEAEHPCPVAQVFESGEPRRVEHVHKNASGQALTVEIYAFPLFGDDGRVEQVVEVQHDVSDRKRAEEERALGEKLDGVLEMAGAVCHELNQPLQVVMAYAEHLQGALSEDDAVQRDVKKILHHVARIAGMTKKLQSITSYETMDYALGKKIIDIDKASGSDE